MRRWSSIGLVALTVTLSSGCLGRRPTTVPIPTVAYPAPGGQPDVTIVLLPGARDDLMVFERRDIVRLIQTRAPGAEILVVDAHPAYYFERTIVERLREDVIDTRPVRDRPVWLVGISLGGLGAAIYGMRHPGDVSCVALLSPFLGPRRLIREIHGAGGPAAWAPDPEDQDPFGDLWTWLSTGGEDGPELLIGYGTGDRMSRAHEMAASLLPRDDVLAIDGGHDWRTWRHLVSNLFSTSSCAWSAPPTPPD